MPPRMERPFGVVSLLEMMEFLAAFFVESMFKLHKWEVQYRNKGAVPYPAVIRAEVACFGVDCQTYGMNGAQQKCGRIVAYIDDPARAVKPLTFEEVSRQMKDLRERLEDDFKAHLFLHVPVADSTWYREPEREWEPVLTRFRVTQSDIIECSKCYALGRYPASVFHAMQIVEHGLIQLGIFLEVKDPKSGWTAVCGELARITKNGYGKAKPGERTHFAFLEQMQALAEAMKNAWRNKIDHAHNRLLLLPGEFTQEIARDIILASRAFMLRLARELPKGTVSQ